MKTNTKKSLAILLSPLLCLLFVACSTGQLADGPKTAISDGIAKEKGLFSTASLVSVYDGDTFKVNLQCAEAVLCHDIPVRVAGIDTPELKTKDKCEKEKAQQAQAFTISFLQGQSIDLRNCKRDKYFRLLCEVYCNGNSLADELIKRGLAYPYKGGAKTKRNYCK